MKTMTELKERVRNMRRNGKEMKGMMIVKENIIDEVTSR
jgi:hypothetical protein